MNQTIDTVLIVHMPSEWETCHRRSAFESLARELPDNASTVCVNRHVDSVVTPLKRFGKYWHGLWRMQVEVLSERLRVVTPRVAVHELIAPHIPGALAVNRRFMARQLTSLLRQSFPKAQRVIQWIHHPHQQWLFDTIPGSGRVYHCYDEYAFTPEGTFLPDKWSREIPVLQSCDLVFATSPLLRDRRSMHARRIELLPNGVRDELSIRRDPSQTELIQRIEHPRLVYMGSPYAIIDYSLLHDVLQRHPEWQLVMLGSIPRQAEGQRLTELTNIHFLGHFPEASLVPLLEQCDVGLIPFQDNEFTRPARPLKLFHYMAAGLPVVSTDLPDMKEFAELVQLVPNRPEAFERAISVALNGERAAISARMREASKDYRWPSINRNSVVSPLREVFGF